MVPTSTWTRTRAIGVALVVAVFSLTCYIIYVCSLSFSGTDLGVPIDERWEVSDGASVPLDDAEWRPASTPSSLSFPTVRWFRRSLPAEVATHRAVLVGGTYTTAVEAYVDGRQFARTSTGTSDVVVQLKRFEVWSLPDDARAAGTLQLRLRCLMPADCHLPGQLKLLNPQQMQQAVRIQELSVLALASVVSVLVGLGVLLLSLARVRWTGNSMQAKSYLWGAAGSLSCAAYGAMESLPFTLTWLPNPYWIYPALWFVAFGVTVVVIWHAFAEHRKRERIAAGTAALMALLWSVMAVAAGVRSSSLLAGSLMLASVFYVVCILGCNAVGFRRVWRSPHPSHAVYLGAVLGAVMAGLYGLALNVGVLTGNIHLFTLGTLSVGFWIGLMSVMHFVSVERINHTLMQSLAGKNQALEVAVEKVTESDRLRGEFLANVSHELRTPLNAIVNVPRLMLDRYSVRVFRCARCDVQVEAEEDETIDESAECPNCSVVGVLVLDASALPKAVEIREHLDVVRQSGESMLRLVNDILDVRKFEVGAMKIERSQIDLASVLQDAIEDEHSLVSERRLHLRVDVGLSSPMDADAERLTQVFANIVTNAFEYSPMEGTVSIRLFHEGTDAVVTVSDEGPGVSAEHQDEIFEPFRQIANVHTKKQGSSGLGLAIAKQYVVLHGGSIGLESPLKNGERGASFWVRLPLTLHDRAQRRDTRSVRSSA